MTGVSNLKAYVTSVPYKKVVFLSRSQFPQAENAHGYLTLNSRVVLLNSNIAAKIRKLIKQWD